MQLAKITPLGKDGQSFTDGSWTVQGSSEQVLAASAAAQLVLAVAAALYLDQQSLRQQTKAIMRDELNVCWIVQGGSDQVLAASAAAELALAAAAALGLDQHSQHRRDQHHKEECADSLMFDTLCRATRKRS